MMEDNFRNALIIISAIVIAAIFIHGFWTIRKNKNPYKLKAKQEPVEPMERGYDHSGFDQDGVGKVRVIGGSELNENEIPMAPAPAPTYEPEPLPKDIESKKEDGMSFEPVMGDLSDVNEPEAENNAEILALNTSQTNDTPAEQEIYKDPVSKAKPSIRQKNVRSGKREQPKVNQMEIKFGDDYDAIENNAHSKSNLGETLAKQDSESDTLEHRKKPEVEQQVIVVSVVMPGDNKISGAALLPTLLTLGLRYGDMNIFHRHQDNAGNGKVTFSLANMMNPGTFDLDQLETFTTQGISLFMTLPNAGDPFEVFEQMMSAAKQLAMEFHGQLLDDKRSVMTKQTEQHYISKIREFERMSRIVTA